LKEADFTIATREDRLKYLVRPYDEVPPTKLVEGCLSYLVTSPGMTLSFLTMKAGSVFELHSHPQEQVMIVLEGYCDEMIGDKLYRMEKGDVAYLPSNVKHGAFLREVDCKVIDIFVPRREDFLEKFRLQNPGSELTFDDR
jgi:quercetin dioxygenase-like cupin family protein